MSLLHIFYCFYMEEYVKSKTLLSFDKFFQPFNALKK